MHHQYFFFPPSISFRTTILICPVHLPVASRARMVDDWPVNLSLAKLQSQWPAQATPISGTPRQLRANIAHTGLQSMFWVLSLPSRAVLGVCVILRCITESSKPVSYDHIHLSPIFIRSFVTGPLIALRARYFFVPAVIYGRRTRAGHVPPFSYFFSPNDRDSARFSHISWYTFESNVVE